MDFALVYIVQRVFYRIGDFFHHWYYDGSRNFAHAYISTLEHFDRTFAVKINFKLLFQPLYKDYSIVGRLLGFIFRFFRILIGVFVYACVSCLFLVIYFAWLLVPPGLAIYAAISRS